MTAYDITVMFKVSCMWCGRRVFTRQQTLAHDRLCSLPSTPEHFKLASDVVVFASYDSTDGMPESLPCCAIHRALQRVYACSYDSQCIPANATFVQDGLLLSRFLPYRVCPLTTKFNDLCTINNQRYQKQHNPEYLLIHARRCHWRCEADAIVLPPGVGRCPALLPFSAAMGNDEFRLWPRR